MAFNRLMLTTAGKTLYAKAQQGKTLHFSRVAIGDGSIGTGSLVNRTALISEKMSLAIDSVQVVNGTESAIITSLSNSALTEGFYFREIGIFAIDPDTSAEVLYLYDNAGTDGEFIPAISSGVTVSERLKFLLLLENVTSVTFTASGNPIYLSVDDIQDGSLGSSILWSSTYIDARLKTLEEHSTDANAHSLLFIAKLDKTGDGKDVTATFSEASTRVNIATGEKFSVMLGKIKKFFTDLTVLAFGYCGSTANQALFTTTNGMVTADKLPVAAGGTGASTADGARTNIGAAKRFSKTATLAVVTWAGSAAPYTYELSDADILATDTPHIDRVTGTDAAAAALINTAWGLIASYAVKPQTAAGTITFYASAIPAVAIPIMYEVVRT